MSSSYTVLNPLLLAVSPCSPSALNLCMLNFDFKNYLTAFRICYAELQTILKDSSHVFKTSSTLKNNFANTWLVYRECLCSK